MSSKLCGVAIEKLTDGFIAYDFTDGPAVGVVRAAPKILQGGAKEMARSMTYRFGILNMAVGGASAGINAKPEERDEIIAGFVSEATEMVASGRLMLDPGKGTTAEQLAPLDAVDSRDSGRNATVDGIALRDHLKGVGAIAATSRALGGSIDAMPVAIDGGGTAGIAAAREAAKRGALVTAIATSKGMITDRAGIDPTAITEAWSAGGDSFIEQLGYEVSPAWGIFGVEAKALLSGSKMGAIDHKVAGNLQVAIVTPLDAVPYTTKATLVAKELGTIVLPDFVTTAGPTFADWPPGDKDPASIEAAAIAAIDQIIDDTAGSDRGPVLEACFWAESFIKTWRDQLPFGRPYA